MPQNSARETSTGNQNFVSPIVGEDGRLTLERENGFTVTFGGFLATPEGRRLVGHSLPNDPPAFKVGSGGPSREKSSAEMQASASNQAENESIRPLTRAQKRANKKARKQQKKQKKQESVSTPPADDEEADKASKSLATDNESEISLSASGDGALLLQTDESSQQEYDLAEAAAKPLPGHDEDEDMNENS